MSTVHSRTRRPPGRVRAVVYAVLVHAAIVLVLVVGFRWTTAPPAPVGKPMTATVVEDPQKRKQEEERRRAEEQRRQDEARKRAEAEQQRIEEQKRQVEQKRVDEQRRLEEARKKAEAQRQAELKHKQEEEARRQEEARKKAEAERQRQEAVEARKRAEESLKQQLAAEEQSREQARAEAARAARAASAMERYRALIQQKVSRNWSRPPGAGAGLKCVVRVRLVPGGDVVQATVVRSSGNAAFDRSVEAAVRKAAPLPLPAEADLFEYFREIEFLFSPEA